MKLKEYIEQLNALIKERPELVECEVYYSRDDEGNGFQQIHSIGGAACYREDSSFIDELIFEEHYKDDPEYYKEEGLEFKINAICIN